LGNDSEGSEWEVFVVLQNNLSETTERKAQISIAGRNGFTVILLILVFSSD
jgi:hypothetical protein